MVSRLVGRIARRSRPPTRESAVVIAVPAVDHLLERLAPGHRANAPGMPAHVTLLYPFLAPDQLDDEAGEGLAAIAGRAGSFRFTLNRLARFPGVLYLAPNPPRPFVELTLALCERWPLLQPYGGAFDAVIPHVTVAGRDEPTRLEAELSAELPQVSVADALLLMAQSPTGRWELHGRFCFGTAGGTTEPDVSRGAMDRNVDSTHGNGLPE